MPDFTLKWYQENRVATAHLGVVNRDNPDKPKVAVICGHISSTGEWKPAAPDAFRCDTCRNMDESGERIVFVMPGTGREVEIRAAQPR